LQEATIRITEQNVLHAYAVPH